MLFTLVFLISSITFLALFVYLMLGIASYLHVLYKTAPASASEMEISSLPQQLST